MSVVNSKLKFQILLLRSTFGAACCTIYDSGYFSVLRAYQVAHSATSNAAYAVYHAAYYVDSDVASDAAKKKRNDVDIGARISGSFREIFKLDSKIQEDIKYIVMINIPVNYESPKSELELVTGLLEVDISTMIPLVQTYWMYSIWNMIICIDNESNYIDDIMKSYNSKCKKLELPDEYKRLLKYPALDFLEESLIRSLIKIVSEYYGLMDRELFINEL